MERYTSIERGDFELLLDYIWDKKGGLPLGDPWAVGVFYQEAAVCSNVIFLLWL